MCGSKRSQGFKMNGHVPGKPVGGKGFTLLETVIAVSLIATIFVSLGCFWVSGAVSWRQNYNLVEVRENLRLGMNQLVRELRQAERIVSYSKNYGGSLTFVSLDGKTITYYRNTSGDSEHAYQLARSVNGAGNNPVARYIKKIEVTPENCDGNTRTIHITLVGEKGETGEIRLETWVTLRGYHR